MSSEEYSFNRVVLSCMDFIGIASIPKFLVWVWCIIRMMWVSCIHAAEVCKSKIRVSVLYFVVLQAVGSVLSVAGALCLRQVGIRTLGLQKFHGKCWLNLSHTHPQPSCRNAWFCCPRVVSEIFEFSIQDWRTNWREPGCTSSHLFSEVYGVVDTTNTCVRNEEGDTSHEQVFKSYVRKSPVFFFLVAVFWT